MTRFDLERNTVIPHTSKGPANSNIIKLRNIDMQVRTVATENVASATSNGLFHSQSYRVSLPKFIKMTGGGAFGSSSGSCIPRNQNKSIVLT